MTKFFLFLITLYQRIFHYFLRNIFGVSRFCRFSPTCSEYAIISIRENGVLKGSYFAIARLLKCQPLYKNYGRNI